VEHEKRRQILHELFGAGGDTVWMQLAAKTDAQKSGSFLSSLLAIKIEGRARAFGGDPGRRRARRNCLRNHVNARAANTP
jgi:hypothetical protein